jgi:hypothetical protein
MREALVISWTATIGFLLLMPIQPGAINAACGAGIIAVVLTGRVLAEFVSDWLWFRRH